LEDRSISTQRVPLNHASTHLSSPGVYSMPISILSPKIRLARSRFDQNLYKQAQYAQYGFSRLTEELSKAPNGVPGANSTVHLSDGEKRHQQLDAQERSFSDPSFN
jgi:hypothetical protein